MGSKRARLKGTESSAVVSRSWGQGWKMGAILAKRV